MQASLDFTSVIGQPGVPPVTFVYSNEKVERKLRRLAETAGKRASRRKVQADGASRNTPRRARIAEGMDRDVERAEELMRAAEGLADAHAAGTIPELLSKVDREAVLTSLLWRLRNPRYSTNSIGRDLDGTGISQTTVEAAVRLLDEVAQPLKRVDPVVVELRRLREEVRFRAIPGYFPTPEGVVRRLLDLACIEAGDSILEPSAGSGHIADAIRREHPGAELRVCEWNHDLSRILEMKGHHVTARNCFDLDARERQYDVIVANPPFEERGDIKHVRHYFELLKSGGRLVAIMSEGSFSTTSIRAVREFQEWFAANNGEDEKLPPGAFLGGDRPTAVNTRLVFLQKP